MTDMQANVIFDEDERDLREWMEANAEAGGARKDGDVFWFDTNGYWDVSENLDGESEGPLFVMYGTPGALTVLATDCGSVEELERRLASSFGDSGWTIDDHGEADFWPRKPWTNVHRSDCPVTEERRDLLREIAIRPTPYLLGALPEYDLGGDQEAENCTCGAWRNHVPRKLTLSERQVRALLSLARIEAHLGGRFPVAEREVRRYRPSETPPVTDASHLTSDEMRDLHVRLEHYCFPIVLPEATVEVEVTR